MQTYVPQVNQNVIDCLVHLGQGLKSKGEIRQRYAISPLMFVMVAEDLPQNTDMEWY